MLESLVVFLLGFLKIAAMPLAAAIVAVIAIRLIKRSR